MYKLSILIPTLVGRSHFLNRLRTQLDQQIMKNNLFNDVEVLVLEDNKEQTIGFKRNALLKGANGKFLTFIDDDDRISEDYLIKIIDKIDSDNDCDCIVFDCICTLFVHNAPDKGGRKYYCKYGIEYEYTKLDPWTSENARPKSEAMEKWFGKPAHTMVWNSKLAKECKFPEKNAGEDFDWVAQAWPKIKKQVKIEDVLYFYDAVLGKNY